MADVFTRRQRSEIMSRVKSTDTAAERRVRSLAHGLGYRFRLHRKDLPGTPDLVFPRLRVAVYVHGCFWHRHAGCPAASMPQSNVAYWTRKFSRNVARDAAAAEALRQLGWNVVVIWECETRNEDRLAERIRCALGQRPRAYPADAATGM